MTEAVDAPPCPAGEPADAPPRAGVMRQARVKLAIVVAGSIAALLAAGFLYPAQADLYEQAFVVAVLRQIVYETPFQPIFLIVAVGPVCFAAARGVSWVALFGGGLITLSIVLPYARFEIVDLESGAVESAHNSLFQLAGPGHRMPEFVSIVALMLIGGLSAMFWRPRVGGLIGVMGVITAAFVWPAVYDDPPLLSGDNVAVFPSNALLFGYYVAWLGALVAVAGPWGGPGSIREWLAARGASGRDAGAPPNEPAEG